MRVMPKSAEAHLLRDLTDIYGFELAQQRWASAMADLLLQANGHASRARRGPGGSPRRARPGCTCWTATRRSPPTA